MNILVDAYQSGISACGECHGNIVTQLFSLKKSRFLPYSPSLPKDFIFMTGCAIGLNEKIGILIGGHHVSPLELPLWDTDGSKIPTNSLNNDQVLEIDISDNTNWNRSSVPLKKVK